jgi:hypothetical protein
MVTVVPAAVTIQTAERRKQPPSHQLPYTQYVSVINIRNQVRLKRCAAEQQATIPDTGPAIELTRACNLQCTPLPRFG